MIRNRTGKSGPPSRAWKQNAGEAPRSARGHHATSQAVWGLPLFQGPEVSQISSIGGGCEVRVGHGPARGEKGAGPNFGLANGGPGVRSMRGIQGRQVRSGRLRRGAMLREFLVWVSLLMCPWVAPAAADKEPDPPDVSRILAVIGPGTMGHACPVSPSIALTAGHVVRHDGLFGPPELLAYRAESAEWAGYLDPEMASDYEDAGLLRAGAPFPSWFRFSLKPPAIGERLWWVGYDWRKGKQAFQRRLFTGRVVTVTAGSIAFDTGTPPGSSGSCVLNSAGEIVAVIAWGMDMEDGKETGVAVGMWPPWFHGLPAPKPAENTPGKDAAK